MSISIFLSHSSADKGFARNLAGGLRSCGADVWIDEAELRIGDSLIQKISTTIAAIDYVVAILSKTSVNSSWVQKELGLAMTREIETRRTIVLPVRIDQCEVPAYLQDKFYADFTSPAHFDESLNRLLKAIGIVPPVHRQDASSESPFKWICLDDGENVLVRPFEYHAYINWLRSYSYVGLGKTEEEAREDVRNQHRYGKGWRHR